VITVYEITNFLGDLAPVSALGLDDPNRVYDVADTNSHERWFCCIDGGHRLCALLILWYSGYPQRLGFEFLICAVIDAEKCFVASIANALNELTSTVARTCLFDKVTTLLELWQCYVSCIESENAKWCDTHALICDKELAAAKKAKDAKLIRKWKTAKKKPRQIKPTIYGKISKLFTF
jgi:hypothetical protein